MFDCRDSINYFCIISCYFSRIDRNKYNLGISWHKMILVVNSGGRRRTVLINSGQLFSGYKVWSQYSVYWAYANLQPKESYLQPLSNNPSCLPSSCSLSLLWVVSRLRRLFMRIERFRKSDEYVFGDLCLCAGGRAAFNYVLPALRLMWPSSSLRSLSRDR